MNHNGTPALKTAHLNAHFYLFPLKTSQYCNIIPNLFLAAQDKRQRNADGPYCEPNDIMILISVSWRTVMEIKAFKAMRFNYNIVGDTGTCVAPPYDVIDPEMRQKLYEKNDYNIVRVIKGKTCSEDTSDNNQYSRAAKFLNECCESQALVQDENQTIYAYTQNFLVGSQTRCRSGFVALGKVEAFGDGVKAHEKTLDGPKADRLNLMRATTAQFGQIFMLFDDPQKVADSIIEKVSANKPLMDFTDDSQVQHSLFAIDDQTDIDAITAMMADKAPIIADGHHRYETALNYYNETQNPNAQFRMMTFVNMHNEGLVILPTHRLVSNLENFNIAELIEKLNDKFDVTEYTFSCQDSKKSSKQQMFAKMAQDFDAQKASLGIYADNGSFYVATLKDFAAMDKFDMSDAAKKLDVNVLHSLIIDGVLGIGDAALASQSNLKYIKDIGDAIEKSIASVDSPDSQVVFFMNSTRIEQVSDIAAAGEKMPQKSTFFHPKVFTGLVINKL